MEQGDKAIQGARRQGHSASREQWISPHGTWTPTSVAQTYGDGRRATYRRMGNRWSEPKVSLPRLPSARLRYSFDAQSAMPVLAALQVTPVITDIINAVLALFTHYQLDRVGSILKAPVRDLFSGTTQIPAGCATPKKTAFNIPGQLVGPI